MNRINKKKLPKYRRRALEQWKDDNAVGTFEERTPTYSWLAWIHPIGEREFISAQSECKACCRLAESEGLPMPPSL